MKQFAKDFGNSLVAVIGVAILCACLAIAWAPKDAIAFIDGAGQTTQTTAVTVTMETP